MATTVFCRGELCRRVANELGERFHWSRLMVLMDTGSIADDFPRIAGRRVFRPAEVGRVVRAARAVHRGRPPRRKETTNA